LSCQWPDSFGASVIGWRDTGRRAGAIRHHCPPNGSQLPCVWQPLSGIRARSLRIWDPRDSTDDIDLEILRALQEDGRLTLRELGNRVGLSEAPIQRRLRSLERNGWIQRYVAILDPLLTNFNFVVFLSVEFESESVGSRDDLERRIADVPEVVECHRVTGSSQYLMKVITSTSQSFDTINRKVMGLPGFQRASRYVSLAQVKDTTALPLPRRARDL
jgi:Lrp/AsnC family transcriptional regulator, leucine-responsive regulatory protein